MNQNDRIHLALFLSFSSSSSSSSSSSVLHRSSDSAPSKFLPHPQEARLLIPQSLHSQSTYGGGHQESGVLGSGCIIASKVSSSSEISAPVKLVNASIRLSNYRMSVPPVSHVRNIKWRHQTTPNCNQLFFVAIQ